MTSLTVSREHSVIVENRGLSLTETQTLHRERCKGAVSDKGIFHQSTRVNCLNRTRNSACRIANRDVNSSAMAFRIPPEALCVPFVLDHACDCFVDLLRESEPSDEGLDAPVGDDRGRGRLHWIRRVGEAWRRALVVRTGSSCGYFLQHPKHAVLSAL